MTTQITNHLFYIVFNHKLLEYLQLKYEAKQKLKDANLNSQLGILEEQGGGALTPRGYCDQQTQRHSMFKLDKVIEFNTILSNLKEKPLYHLYTKFKENLQMNRYSKFISMKTQKTIDESKAKKKQ